VEYFPIGVTPDQSGVLLHETGHLPRNDWWNFPNTLSPFWRLYFNGLSGHKVVFSKGEYSLNPEHIVLIPDFQLFHSVGNVPVPHTWLMFQVARRLAPEQSIPILLKPTAMELELLRELARQVVEVNPVDRERLLHLSLALLHITLAREEIHWQSQAPSRELLKAINHMDNRFAEHLNVDDLAKVAGVGARAFTKAFKRHQGVTPGVYLMQVRVRHAADLLTLTQDSMEAIAEKAGFPNRYYLSRVFKHIIGESPARFRRKYSMEGTHGAAE
jgi:AraC-like DNA-binding protein